MRLVRAVEKTRVVQEAHRLVKIGAGLHIRKRKRVRKLRDGKGRHAAWEPDRFGRALPRIDETREQRTILRAGDLAAAVERSGFVHAADDAGIVQAENLRILRVRQREIRNALDSADLLQFGNRERAIEQIERLLTREDLIALPCGRKHVQFARGAHPGIVPPLPFPLRDVDLRAVIGRVDAHGERRALPRRERRGRRERRTAHAADEPEGIELLHRVIIPCARRHVRKRQRGQRLLQLERRKAGLRRRRLGRFGRRFRRRGFLRQFCFLRRRGFFRDQRFLCGQRLLRGRLVRSGMRRKERKEHHNGKDPADGASHHGDTHLSLPK